MRKIVLLAMMLLLSIPMMFYNSSASAQTKALPKLMGMSGGLGIPIEFYDLEAVGMNIHLSFDYAYPIAETFALGFYIGLGGGFMGAVHPYSEYDRYYYPFKFSGGLLMEVGELNDRPYILGIGPCTGLGFVDMDLILPWEFRFGRFVSERWYVMFELTSGVSLDHETAYIEPSIRVGYNFGN